MKVQGYGQAKVLSGEEIKKLFEALKGDRDQALFARFISIPALYLAFTKNL